MVENLADADLAPATRFTPPGVPRGRRRGRRLALVPGGGGPGPRAGRAREAAVVKRRITLLHVDGPGNRDVALALRDAWNALGMETTVRARPPEEYLDF